MSELKNPEESATKVQEYFQILVCPSCGEAIQIQFPAAYHHDQGADGLILSGLPAGVKFDPTDQEILGHLEAKLLSESGGNKLHPLIEKFIPTIETPGGICYTQPQNLPGVSNDGQPRHFFHRPSNAYAMGSRKRRRVEGNDDEEDMMRWHKTGKTRPIFMSPPLAGAAAKGFKKILVLYTNYGRKRKPQKTNWVMHQYHIGGTQEEEHGQLVLSKVFYRKPPAKQTGPTGIRFSDLGHVSDDQSHQLYGKQPGFYCYDDELGKVSHDQLGMVPYFGGDQGQGSNIASVRLRRRSRSKGHTGYVSEHIGGSRPSTRDRR